MTNTTFLYFPGCKITPFLPRYDRATRAVLGHFDIRLDRTELTCCGYPVRDRSMAASVLAAARNLAIADQKGLPLLTPCQCCYGNLKQAAYWLNEDTGLRRFVNRQLAEEGLRWHPRTPVRHLLTVLTEDVGLDRIRQHTTRSLDGRPVAAHYGCHALRPGHVVQLDNPLAPTIFENLLTAIGATPVDWSLRLDCCGHPVSEKNPDLSRKLMTSKLEDAYEAGAQVVATACTYCQIQFATAPTLDHEGGCAPVSTRLISQLLVEAFGLTVPGVEGQRPDS